LTGENLPLNPAGRTGLTGLGGCKRLGENKAADPVVTRLNPKTGDLEILLGFKAREEQWCLPGGTVDEGEDPADACSRELHEEVGLTVDMSRGRVVYQGFVDDHRNTDNAWFSTQARHVHLDRSESDQEPVASDDIEAAKWVPVSSITPAKLFASHGQIVFDALSGFKP
jgi:ADP-ribose pyrophosphatase